MSDEKLPIAGLSTKVTGLLRVHPKTTRPTDEAFYGVLSVDQGRLGDITATMWVWFGDDPAGPGFYPMVAVRWIDHEMTLLEAEDTGLYPVRAVETDDRPPANDIDTALDVILDTAGVDFLYRPEPADQVPADLADDPLASMLADGVWMPERFVRS